MLVSFLSKTPDNDTRGVERQLGFANKTKGARGLTECRLLRKIGISVNIIKNVFLSEACVYSCECELCYFCLTERRMRKPDVSVPVLLKKI